MNKTAKLAFAFLLLVGGVLALVTAAARSRREPVSIQPLGTTTVARSQPAELLTEYTLTEQGGREFRSTDLAGTPHVVNFFFASCPSYCRMQTMEVQKLAAEFGPQGIVFLSITCDPDNDSPAALQTYAGMFNANPEQWKFLTGDMLLLRRIGGELYSVHVDTQTHTEHLVVVDKWGKVRGRYAWRNHPKEIAELKELLPKLLAETEPPPEPAAAPAMVIDEETGLPVKAAKSAALPAAGETPAQTDESTEASSAGQTTPGPSPQPRTPLSSESEGQAAPGTES